MLGLGSKGFAQALGSAQATNQPLWGFLILEGDTCRKDAYADEFVDLQTLL